MMSEYTGESYSVCMKCGSEVEWLENRTRFALINRSRRPLLGGVALSCGCEVLDVDVDFVENEEEGVVYVYYLDSFDQTPVIILREPISEYQD